MDPDSAKRSRFEAFTRLRARQFARYALVSVDPPIFHVQPNLDMVDQFLPSYEVLFSALRGRRSYVLFRHSCAVNKRVFAWIRELETRCRQQFPEVEWIQLCNKSEYVELFRAQGSRAIFCNSNCFVDEAVFRPLPHMEKRFDAVYNARFDKLKRHYLAGEIASLALIYDRTDKDPDYVRKTRNEFAQAHFFNHSASGKYRVLQLREINESLNLCRVGLCLSENEGAMFASGEYLLAGLPIVATPSPGGRDVFFESAFVLTVPPEPRAIREAVRELIDRRVPPEIPRNAMLEKARSHRQAFISVVQEIYDRHGVERRFADEWPRLFPEQKLADRSHFETIGSIQAADAARAG